MVMICWGAAIEAWVNDLGADVGRAALRSGSCFWVRVALKLVHYR